MGWICLLTAGNESVFSDAGLDVVLAGSLRSAWFHKRPISAFDPPDIGKRFLAYYTILHVAGYSSLQVLPIDWTSSALRLPLKKTGRPASACRADDRCPLSG